jgi:hypothetical protein
MNQNDGGSGGSGGSASGIISGINPNYGPGGGSGGAYQGGAAQGGGFSSPPQRPKFSFNRFVVEPYISTREVKTATTGRTEFARIEQKIAVKGLRLLVDILLDGGMQTSLGLDGVSTSQPLTIKAGSLVFIREEYLHTQAWAKNILESDHVGKFILVEKQFVEFIQPI